MADPTPEAMELLRLAIGSAMPSPDSRTWRRNVGRQLGEVFEVMDVSSLLAKRAQKFVEAKVATGIITRLELNEGTQRVAIYFTATSGRGKEEGKEESVHTERVDSAAWGGADVANKAKNLIGWECAFYIWQDQFSDDRKMRVVQHIAPRRRPEAPASAPQERRNATNETAGPTGTVEASREIQKAINARCGPKGLVEFAKAMREAGIENIANIPLGRMDDAERIKEEIIQMHAKEDPGDA